MIASGKPPREDPIPNVQASITAWKTILAATSPLAGVRVNIRGNGKEEGFVDVIARGGAEWIRMYRWVVVRMTSDSESLWGEDGTLWTGSVRAWTIWLMDIVRKNRIS